MATKEEVEKKAAAEKKAEADKKAQTDQAASMGVSKEGIESTGLSGGEQPISHGDQVKAVMEGVERHPRSPGDLHNALPARNLAGNDSPAGQMASNPVTRGYNREDEETPELADMDLDEEARREAIKATALAEHSRTQKERRADYDSDGWKRENIVLRTTKKHYTADGRFIEAGQTFNAVRGDYVSVDGKRYKLPPYLNEFKPEKRAHGE